MTGSDDSRADFAQPRVSSGDFSRLVGVPGTSIQTHGSDRRILDVHGTTVIALKYAGGVLNLGDRRATAANAVMYDRAEKIVALDDSTMMAISGSFGKSVEIARYLRHAFKYYLRTQLQPMSLDGKLQEVSRAIQGNLQMAIQGIGAFIPILSAFDADRAIGRVFAFDAMGARFETLDFAAAGSGSERIRGIFDYLVATKGPFGDRPLDEVLHDALIMLDIAADLDSATGGYSKILPTAKIASADGITDLEPGKLEEAVDAIQRGTAGV